MIKIKKSRLDYRSTEQLVNSQINQINQFIQGKDVLDFDIDNEFIYGIYLTSSPSKQRFFVGKQIKDELSFDEDWLKDKTIIKFVAKEDFVIALVE